MVDAMAKITSAVGLVGVMRGQVIEGTPGHGFQGRLSFALEEQRPKIPITFHEGGEVTIG